MVVGGAAGSTAGGIKLVRLISLSKGTAYGVTDFFYPEDERTFAISEETAEVTAGQSSAEFDQAALVGFLWIVLLLAGVTIAASALPTGSGGHSLETVVFEVASAQGNVGLTTGITDPETATPVKLALVANMYVGRLEIVPVLVTTRALLRGFES